MSRATAHLTARTPNLHWRFFASKSRANGRALVPTVTHEIVYKQATSKLRVLIIRNTAIAEGTVPV